MAQFCRNEQRRHATFAGQFQPALDESHRQIGIVLVAARAGRPEPAVPLGETVSQRARQRLAPHPRRDCRRTCRIRRPPSRRRSAPSSRRWGVRRHARVVAWPRATRAARSAHAASSILSSRARPRCSPNSVSLRPCSRSSAIRRLDCLDRLVPVMMPPPPPRRGGVPAAPARFVPPAAVMATCLARRSSAAAAASGRCSPCRLQSVSPWRTTASRFGQRGHRLGIGASRRRR